MNTTIPQSRPTMNGKPVHTIPAKTVINFDSGFSHKLLCDGPTFSTGEACVYKCAFCYVPDLVRKQRPYFEKHGVPAGARHEDIVIRRADPLATMRAQLTDAKGNPKFLTFDDRRVIYASPKVDVAGNMELVRETVDACKLILDLTNWDIRLLSKSNLLPKIAEALADHRTFLRAATPGGQREQRVIFGVSTGTLDNKLAQAFEEGTPLVSKRLESIHWLQDHGFRTFGMICPSLPVADYDRFALEMKAAIRADRCEHVWAEVINVRGESYSRTLRALSRAGFDFEADMMVNTFTQPGAWEDYARATFEAHVTAGYLPGQLRFLQYITAASKPWWKTRESDGAILL